MMKPRIFVSLLLTLIFPLSGLMVSDKSVLQYRAVPSAVMAAQDYYYYADGNKVPLELSTKEVAVGMKDTSSQTMDVDIIARKYSSLLDSFAEKHDLPKAKVSILKLKAGLTHDEVNTLISDLSREQRLEFVSPVFTYRSEKLILTRQIIVQFNDRTPDDEVANVFSEFDVEIIEAKRWGQNNYIVRVKSVLALDALTVANTLHESPLVQYAHPNFLRIINRFGSIPQKQSSVPVSSYYTLAGSGPGRAELPSSVVDIQTDPQNDNDPVKPEPPEKSYVQPFSNPWATLMREEFEGHFPNGLWRAYDENGATNGEYYWDDTLGKSRDLLQGQWSAWCADGGVDGSKLNWLVDDYANNMRSWMVYGPFDLSDATYAELSFWFWAKTEDCSPDPCDYFAVYASVDGRSFWGTHYWGNWASAAGNDDGWIYKTFDLTDVYALGDLTGESRVWIAFYFHSDGSVTEQGAFVDDVVLRKISGERANAISNDPYSWRQWALLNVGQALGTPQADIRAPEAWAVNSCHSDIIIAIIDEGVDLWHDDLNLVTGYDATGRGSGGGPEPRSDDAHGTAAAGIAAAIGNNRRGMIGVCPGASIMPVRIAYGTYEDGERKWITYDSWTEAGIRYAADNGARVLSNSWSWSPPSTSITEAIRYARDQKKCVVVFAAGNDNENPVAYPAKLSEVIAVGASNPCDERKNPSSCDGESWWGSNYGPELDVVAPGVLINTTDISGSRGYNAASGDYTSKFNGTSAATPHVAGLAALILSANPTLTPDQVQQVIQDTADDIGSAGRDSETGYGRINAYRAILEAKSLNRITIIRENFEGVFPTGSWQVLDNDGTTNGEYYWDDDDYRPYRGGWSAWCANGGADARTPPAVYPNNMKSWMIYGPFSLADAIDAGVDFHYWLKSESGYDFLYWGASVDGQRYYVRGLSGNSNGWVNESFDLKNIPTLDDLTGRSQVWIAFIFESDSSITDEGAYLDDITIWKIVR